MLLLSTASLTWYGLHKIFGIAQKSNYDWIELVLSKNQYDFWDEEYILNLVKEFNIPVLSVKAPSRWVNERLVDRIVSLAKKIKAQNITFTPPHFRDKNIDWYLKYLKEIKANNNISISIENVDPTFIFLIIPKYRDANLRQIKKITWDTALNISSIDQSSGQDIIKAKNVLWTSIKNIYISDTNWPKKWLLPWNAWGWISSLPIESFLMKLKSTSYNWLVTLEVNPKELWVWSEERILNNLEYFKNYYDKYTK